MKLELALSRSEIADYLGLTIETVSRQITSLKRRGVIVLEGTRVVDEGRPHELATRDGVFARLFEIARPAGIDA